MYDSGISFIVPCFNRSHTIFKTIESIQKNINTPFEILIIDDGSTDGTAEILRKNSFEQYVKVYYQEFNKGQNFARNFGIQHSKYDIVTILDSDDFAALASYNEVINLFIHNSELVCAFTYCESMSTGQILSNVQDKIVVVNKAGFVDGTYDGEYQAFLRKSMLPEKIFREGLGVKRSCTILSWLELHNYGRVLIFPIVTKLYRDYGTDRMGNLKNVIADANELEFYFNLIYNEHSEYYRSIGLQYYARLVSVLNYYRLIARGRFNSLKVLRDPYFLKGAPVLYFRHILFIILGSSLTIHLRVISAVFTRYFKKINFNK
jgi:glycosyltransferase involved in cell wall biosynthesis